MAANALVTTERIQNPESRLPTSKRVYQQVMRYVQPVHSS